MWWVLSESFVSHVPSFHWFHEQFSFSTFLFSTSRQKWFVCLLTIASLFSVHIRARLVVPQSKISFFISANTGCNNPTKKEETKENSIICFLIGFESNTPPQERRKRLQCLKNYPQKKMDRWPTMSNFNPDCNMRPCVTQWASALRYLLISLSDINHILLAGHRNIARFSLLISSTWP